ncbi:hypothetical protein D9619_011368 [Psilocybe cf. subviscida]|uniref:DUF6535 domain-containing protein n=1 Tax=Psilocybe cf. subviscida TaxID=2480587 RepID=A0A8H5BJA5_9AGAR|nr:hypothetical protein D9619_011368 [Psilocybe cf. subviscida]
MTQEAKFKNGPQMWNCGNDFENPIPTGTGKDSESEVFDKNHWKVVFDSYLEADRKQCEQWKDEVNTLLVFAGLFSAVITAFLIESYKYLLPQGSPDPSKFVSNSPHVIRLNSLWFCSLVLALSSAAIGIVALQWIRNHERYHDIKPRDALSVYEMRTKAIRAWHIRWAFLSLPLLVLVALVLFFVGLVDFLLSLNKEVAAPVAVLVYSTLALLFITTVLPSLQIFRLYFFTPDVKTNADMPTPCPYKSPQSWIFHRFLIYMIRFVRYLKRTLLCGDDVQIDIVSLPDMPLYFTFHTSPSKWTDYDTKWLRLRDMYSQTMATGIKGSFASIYMEHPRRPIHDEAQILINTVSKKIPSADVLFAAYHCFREISKNALYQGFQSTTDYANPKHIERNAILRGYYWKHIPHSTFTPVSNLVASPSPHLLHDENMLVFLKMHNSDNLPEEASRIISTHLLELQARILAYTYVAEPAHELKIPADSRIEWLDMMSLQYQDLINSTTTIPKFKIWSQFSPGSLNGNEVSVSTGTIKKAVIHFSMIFERFVQHIAESGSLDWQGTTIYAHRNTAQFLAVPVVMLRYRGTDQNPFDVFSRFETSFNIIQTALGDTPVPNIDPKRADYLFLFACLFIERLLSQKIKPPLTPFKEVKHCERMADFIEALSSFEQRKDSPIRIKENWRNFWSKTGLPGAPTFKSRSDATEQFEPAKQADPNKLSYIHWERIPDWIPINPPAPPAR